MLVELHEIIKLSSNPPQKQDRERLRTYLKSHPEVVNQTDEANQTACHYAIDNIGLFELLVLEGNATIPDNLTENPILLNKIKKLKKEQFRPKIGFHLHDYLRNQALNKVVLERVIKNKCTYFRDQINELSYYWRRNACHWAAIMGRSEYLEMLVKEGGNLLAEDLDGKTPLDLAADEKTRAVIEKLLKSPPAKTSDELINEQEVRDGNLVDRIKTDIEGLSLTMMRALSPPRIARPKVEQSGRKATSPPPSNPKYYERHHRVLSANLSPREQGAQSGEKQKRATSPTNTSILKRILSADSAGKETTSPTRAKRSHSLSYDAPPKETAVRPRTSTIVEPEKARRTIRFLENPLPVVVLEPILPNQNSSPESPSSPVKALRPQLQISVANLLAIFKEEDRFKDFKKYYRHNKIMPNENLPELWGRTCIIQAVLTGASSIFMFLIKEGANLEVKTEKGKTLSDCILENQPVQRIEFLKRMRSLLVEQIKLKNLTAKKEQLVRAESQLRRQFNIQGLQGPSKSKVPELDQELFKTIAQKRKLSEKLVQTLYNLCLGFRITENDDFHADVVKNLIIGLLIHKSRTLVALLSDLYPHLQRQQKVAAIFIVKEIILQDQFYSCYRNKQFFEKLLPEFCKLIEEDDFTLMAQGLRTLVDLQFHIDHRYVNAINILDNILLQCDMTLPEPDEHNPEAFANAARALTAQFWRTVKITELVGKAWEKPGVALHVRNQFETFNKLSQYLVLDVLKQPPEKEQSRIKFYVKVMHELIHEKPCDLESAKALSSGFYSRFLNRQMQTFVDSKSDLVKLYLDDQEILSVTNNFEGQRQLIENSSGLVFPWLGYLTKRLVLAEEGNKEIQAKADVEGKLYAYIMRLQDRIKREYPMTAQTKLGHLLYIRKELSDDALHKVSMALNPKPINLSTVSLSFFRDLLDVHIEHNLPLRVFYKTDLEECTTVQVIFIWLKDYVSTEGLSHIDEVNKTIHKLGALSGLKAAVMIERVAFMDWLKDEVTQNPKLANLKIYFDKKPKNKERQDDEDDSLRLRPH